MAIQTGKFLREKEEEATEKSIAEQLSKAMAGEEKRKGRSGLFGKGLGFLGGEALQWGMGLALTGLTGGMAAGPMLAALKSLQTGGKYAKVVKAGLKGAGMFAGKAAAHQATTGKYGKALKTSGQVEEIVSDSKYGTGKKEAKTLSEELARSRKSEQDLGTFAGDVGGAIALDFAGQGLGDLFRKTPDAATELLPEELETSSFVPRGEGTMDTLADIGQSDEIIGRSDEIIGEEGWSELYKEEGGLVPNQSRTIAGYFDMQGKTLGGSDKQTVAQMLGLR